MKEMKWKKKCAQLDGWCDNSLHMAPKTHQNNYIETQIWCFGKSKFLFPVFITQIHFFEFLVMKSKFKNLAKQHFFCGSHVFWIMGDENWVI